MIDWLIDWLTPQTCTPGNSMTLRKTLDSDCRSPRLRDSPRFDNTNTSNDQEAVEIVFRGTGRWNELWADFDGIFWVDGERLRQDTCDFWEQSASMFDAEWSGSPLPLKLSDVCSPSSSFLTYLTAHNAKFSHIHGKHYLSNLYLGFERPWTSMTSSKCNCFVKPNCLSQAWRYNVDHTSTAGRRLHAAANFISGGLYYLPRVIHSLEHRRPLQLRVIYSYIPCAHVIRAAMIRAIYSVITLQFFVVVDRRVRSSYLRTTPGAGLLWR